MLRVAIAAIFVFLLAACNDGGVCCELQNPCTVGGNGGWAETEARCQSGNGFDGEFVLEMDERGCDVWTPAGTCPGGQMCCTR
jgi:hypothetical protein